MRLRKPQAPRPAGATPRDANWILVVTVEKSPMVDTLRFAAGRRLYTNTSRNRIVSAGDFSAGDILAPRRSVQPFAAQKRGERLGAKRAPGARYRIT